MLDPTAFSNDYHVVYAYTYQLSIDPLDHSVNDQEAVNLRDT